MSSQSPKYAIHSKTYEGATFPNLNRMKKWDIAFVGSDPISEIDDRSKQACSFVKSQSEATYQLNLNIDTNSIFINGREEPLPSIRRLIAQKESILVEATTLAYPEILQILHAAHKERISKIDFLYVEPIEYRRTAKGSLINYRLFNLSDNHQYKAIPKFPVNMNMVPKGRAVFFLGYENFRVAQALEQVETLQSWNKSAVIGFPAFSYGMETDCLANNAQQLLNDFQINYIPASSVKRAYDFLRQLRLDDKLDNPIVVLPLGTKPHAIGAALFVLEYPSGSEAITLFDHPNKISERSSKIRRWHIHHVTDTMFED